MSTPKETESNSRVNAALETISDQSGWADEYWDSLFQPLRTFLIRRLRYHHGRRLHQDDITDAADEVIFRLCKTFDFNQFASISIERRRAAFYGFVKQTVRSVIADTYAQKGLVPLQPAAGRQLSPAMVEIMHQPGTPELIVAAFKALCPDEQEILRLKLFQKLSYRDLKVRYEEMGYDISISALKMRVVRATKALRQQLLRVSGEA
jgi:hypothetical protein